MVEICPEMNHTANIAGANLPTQTSIRNQKLILHTQFKKIVTLKFLIFYEDHTYDFGTILKLLKPASK